MAPLDKLVIVTRKTAVEELIEQLIRKQIRDDRSAAMATRGVVPGVRVRRLSHSKVIPMLGSQPSAQAG